MTSYRVKVTVKEVRGHCVLGLKPGDESVIEKFYVLNSQNTRICLHALIGMSSLLLPFLKGISARELGIGIGDDVGFVQCPDPGESYTNGGTVVFELRRGERLEFFSMTFTILLDALPSPKGDPSGSSVNVKALSSSARTTLGFKPTIRAKPALTASCLSVELRSTRAGFYILGWVASSRIPSESAIASFEFSKSTKK